MPTINKAPIAHHSDSQPAQGPRCAINTPINAHRSSPAQSPSPSRPLAVIISPAPSKLPTDSSGSNLSGTSSPGEAEVVSDSSGQDSGWTVVSPRRFRGPRVPPPYFRIPSHLWPSEIKKKYLRTTPSAESVSPVASRTRARTTT